MRRSRQMWGASAGALATAVVMAGCASEPPERAMPTPTTSASTSAPIAPTPPSVPAPPSAPTPPSAGGKVYLALGDSLTAGFQVARGDDKGGAYPALLALGLAAEGVPLQVENLACTGESTTDLLSGGRCRPSPSSQLREAERIAAQGNAKVALVTLLVGANDVLRCISTSSIDPACLAEGEEVYRRNLPEILRRLRAAVGPGVPMAVLLYYDPFRQTIAGRTPSATFRQASAAATERLNAALTDAAHLVDADVVDLRDLLEGSDGAALCTMTLVCTTGDFHFTASANAAVADRLRQVMAPKLAP